MSFQLAIHEKPGSFSDRWIERCRLTGIPHKIVNCYESDIISKLSEVDGLMWHWDHGTWTEVMIARSLITVLESTGRKVFPSMQTCWHFDDKVAQKYLLESISAPYVKAHVFYDLSAALKWIGETSFPKVLKLRKGAGSRNVRLVRTRSKARYLAVKAFGVGFKPSSGVLADFNVKVSQARIQRDFSGKLARLPRSIMNIWMINHYLGRERGYVFFQDFVPNNTFDTRVTIIGDRAFALTRGVRSRDFRASGSGRLNYDLDLIDTRCIEISFDVAKKTGSQSTAFDFVRDDDGKPQIVEVSYAYNAKAIYDCPGHWDARLNWHSGHTWPEDAILDDFLKELANQQPTL